MGGGVIFCQLWHIGRIGHPSWKDHPFLASAPPGSISLPSVSASAIAAKGKTLNIFPEGSIGPNTEPRALDEAEIPRLIEDYRHATSCAVRAGFDGVEVHGAHGYLLDQFLRDGTNRRTDRYGGSPENRARLLLEVMDAVVSEMGPGHVAVRLSPTRPGSSIFFSAEDGNVMDADGLHETYGHVVKQLNKLPLAYLLFTEPRWFGGKYDGDVEKDPGFNMPVTNSATYRKAYKGVLMAAGGFTPSTAEQTVRDGTCDVVAFGRFFISNPDLPERLRTGARLNRYDRKTFYTWEAEGYTDYPDLSGKVGALGKYDTLDPLSIGVPQAKL
eukprot:NODE_1806_length_1059_cov_8.667331.p1 GENE.NODE_1806_length_1059_cov_8.667331~~NODE_1806_length_1059_cov_8.667331.p1  ORF type:complete len:328 (+),score=39.40 NODE_1806_length_1059_cov_8.667331:3-986(+)